MTGALILGAFGMALLAILLAVLYFRQPNASLASDGKKDGESRTVLTALNLNLPSRVVADRIFAQDDWDFVRRESSSLEKTFLKERKKVALLWTKDTRTCVARIFRFYRITVRSNAALEFWTELRIAVNYFVFVLTASGVQLLIFLRGPFYAHGTIMSMLDTADRVSVGVGRTLAALDPSSLVKIKDDWARQASPIDY